MAYAVRWNENDGPEHVGGLAVDHGSLVLSEAGERFAEPDLLVPHDELADIYLERRSGGPTPGRPTLVVITHDGTRFRIASLEGLGALHELAEQLTEARGKTAV